MAEDNRGRPIVHTEPWAKITVVLLDRHVAYLERVAIDIRLKHGKAITRDELIRGLIEAALANTGRASQEDASQEEFVSQFAGTIEESESP